MTMKYYANEEDPECKGVHTIRVRLQMGKHKGSFTYQIHGRCKGLDLLVFDMESTDPESVNGFLNELGTVELDVDNHIFTINLVDPETNEKVEFELVSDEEFNDMIVGIEIVDFKVING